jgi:hypothetical protein
MTARPMRRAIDGAPLPLTPVDAPRMAKARLTELRPVAEPEIDPTNDAFARRITWLVSSSL